MADGRTHAKYNMIGIGVATAVATLSLAQSPAENAAFAAGILLGAIGGTIWTPDIDHAKITHEEHRIFYLFGNTIGWLHHIYWIPYEKVMPHRSIFSHVPVLSTALRICYLLIPYFCYLYTHHLPIPNFYHQTWWTALFIAWSCQDLIHFALDDFRAH